ncbi:hypothetical protein CI593_07070 [Fischerella thermalis CCMEE 5194]|nr:hypothetical protein CI593_07070 [Fischerella thermalis CCMEE 5194]
MIVTDKEADNKLRVQRKRNKEEKKKGKICFCFQLFTLFDSFTDLSGCFESFDSRWNTSSKFRHQPSYNL